MTEGIEWTPSPTLWIRRVQGKCMQTPAPGLSVATGLCSEAVNVTYWLRPQRICSCRSDHLEFVSRLHLQTSSSNDSHIYFLGLSYHLPAALWIIIFVIFQIISQCPLYPPPFHWHPTFCFINPHYHWLSAASSTSSTSNITALFPHRKNLSSSPTTWCQVSFISSLVTNVIRVSLLNVISLMGKWKRAIFNLFNIFLRSIYLNTKSTLFSLNLFHLIFQETAHYKKNASRTLLCSYTYPRTTVQDRNNFGWHPRHKRSEFHFRD